MTFDLVALKDEQAAARGARPRRSLDLETESFVRVLPIRWRLLLIAALNATVAVILATLIWNGANVLSRAWDDVRRVRESDKLLVLLESEASRLQTGYVYHYAFAMLIGVVALVTWYLLPR